VGVCVWRRSLRAHRGRVQVVGFMGRRRGRGRRARARRNSHQMRVARIDAALGLQLVAVFRVARDGGWARGNLPPTSPPQNWRYAAAEWERYRTSSVLRGYSPRFGGCAARRPKQCRTSGVLRGRGAVFSPREGLCGEPVPSCCTTNLSPGAAAGDRFVPLQQGTGSAGSGGPGRGAGGRPATNDCHRWQVGGYLLVPGVFSPALPMTAESSVRSLARCWKGRMVKR
jgi:hypothetical protein